jgi:hypothetical protein
MLPHLNPPHYMGRKNFPSPFMGKVRMGVIKDSGIIFILNRTPVIFSYACFPAR